MRRMMALFLSATLSACGDNGSGSSGSAPASAPPSNPSATANPQTTESSGSSSSSATHPETESGSNSATDSGIDPRTSPESSTESGQEPTSNPDNNKSEILGSWVSQCLSGQQRFSFYQLRYQFQAEQVSAVIQPYQDQNCTLPIETDGREAGLEIRFALSVHQPITTEAGIPAHQVDMMSESSLSETEAVISYDILAVISETLYFGKKTQDYPGTSPFTRPRVLNYSAPFFRLQ